MNELNVFNGGATIAKGADSVQSQMMMSRQSQEVQAAMVVAKRFPRDCSESMNRILHTCQRKTLAEAAMYSYPKGGKEVTGPSIRLAEAMAQNWGNIDFGIIELEQRSKESQVMAYAWDLETNTRQTKIFSVPHLRVSKKGSTVLTDPRDIYEMVANQGARRLRACILGVIPGDVIESAVKQCELTLVSGKEPIEVRIKKMLSAFAEMDVDENGITAYIGKNTSAFNEQDILRLTKAYRSMKDGFIGSDYFKERLTSTTANEEKKELPTKEDNAKAEVTMDDL